MQQTFSDLGIPFPLFEGPVSDASDYIGRARCTICDESNQHCFNLDIGSAVVVSCGACGTQNGMDASDREGTSCRKCDGAIAFPFPDVAEIHTCYACLRAGRAAMTKDTELGMISWEQAFAGITHGGPGLARTDFEMVPLTGSDWVGARLPQEVMFELLRTPTYLTIQGDRWQFCCKRPMTYLGAWSREEFTKRAPNRDGRQFFASVVQDIVPGLWEDKLHDDTGMYVFRCSTCSRLTAHWDLA